MISPDSNLAPRSYEGWKADELWGKERCEKASMGMVDVIGRIQRKVKILKRSCDRGRVRFNSNFELIDRRRRIISNALLEVKSTRRDLTNKPWITLKSQICRYFFGRSKIIVICGLLVARYQDDVVGSKWRIMHSKVAVVKNCRDDKVLLLSVVNQFLNVCICVVYQCSCSRRRFIKVVRKRDPRWRRGKAMR